MGGVGVIASVRGTLEHIGVGEMIVDVGGVGLRLAVPTSALEETLQPGQPVHLHTTLVVRDDSISLYGFPTVEQRQLFDLLLQVSGVGPRLALTVVSNITPEVLRASVAQGQPQVLARVPGIGRKTAEKIVFHLKDRIGTVALAEARLHLETDTEVVQALITLGYSLVEAQAAAQSIPEDAPQDVEERIRLALRHFTRP
jgi:Holliday junction DNA helicase RuvA